jgi:hypothetical protein
LGHCVLGDAAQAQGPEKNSALSLCSKKEKAPRPDHIQTSVRLCYNISDNNVRRILAESSIENSFLQEVVQDIILV